MIRVLLGYKQFWMSPMIKTRALLLTLGLLSVSAPAMAAGPVTGSYVTEDGKAVVRITPCGGGKICGKISKILAPTPNGPPRDENNPNKALRNRPILGLPILLNFRDAGDVWKGKIYSPEEGKTYDSKIVRLTNGKLKVQGCVLFICKTQYWPAR